MNGTRRGVGQYGGGHSQFSGMGAGDTGGAIPRMSQNTVVLGGSPLHTLSNLPKSVFQRLGLVKPDPANLSLEQQRALDQLERSQLALDQKEAQIKESMMHALSSNPNNPLTRQRAELAQIKLDRAKNDKYITAIVTQRSHLQRRRTDTQVMSLLNRGNQELRQETDAAQAAYDIGDITGDFDELVNEGVDDQIEILEGFNQVDPMARLNEVNVSSASGDGPTMGEELDDEIEALRRQAVASQEMQTMQIKESLPTVMSGQRPSTTTSAPSKERVYAPYPVSSSGNVTGSMRYVPPPSGAPRQSSSMTASPFSANANRALDDDLAWLQ